ncbi:hypothetical protein [Actinophytocola sediminis]
MADDDIDTGRELVSEKLEYERPVVFDFGPVFDVTRGSGSQNSDDNGQGYS